MAEPTQQPPPTGNIPAPPGPRARQSAVPSFIDKEGLSPEELAAAVRLEQARRWRQGERGLIEVYLAEFPALRTEPAHMLELIDQEIDLREGMGEVSSADEYLRRFPEHGPALERRFALREAVAAGLLRQLAVRRPAPEDARTLAPAQTTPSPVPAEGTAVPGYEIVKELGRGGMGVVYQARHTALKRTVALKMILAGAHAGEADLARFRTEAEAVARLQHPNIVQIHEVGERGGLPFFSLEYVDGGCLADKLDGKPWPGRQAAELVEVLARAVDYAHQRGVVHRDLKPQNILLTADGTPKIADFGLAKQLEEQKGLTRTGAVLGTPSYMAPEQAEGKPKEVGPAADVYALGAILYELLTGQPPFHAATALDTILLVVSADPVAPGERNPRVPRDLETVCLKCLQKQPARRYGSARELADDLRCFLTGEPVRARPPGAWHRVRNGWRRADRWTRQAAGLGLPSVLLGGSLLLLVGLCGGGVLSILPIAVLSAFMRAKGKPLLLGTLLFALPLPIGLLLWRGGDLPAAIDQARPIWGLIVAVPILGGAVCGLVSRGRSLLHLGALLVIAVLTAVLWYELRPYPEPMAFFLDHPNWTTFRNAWLSLDPERMAFFLGVATGLGAVYGVAARGVSRFARVPALPCAIGAVLGTFFSGALPALLRVSDPAAVFIDPATAEWVPTFVVLSLAYFVLTAVLGAGVNAAIYRGMQSEERERRRRWGGV